MQLHDIASSGDPLSGPLIYPRGASDIGPPVPECARPAIETNEHVSTPLVFTGIFSTGECERVIELGLGQRWRTGRMMYVQPNIRKSSIAWVRSDAQSEWLYEKIWRTFLAVNRWYRFELHGLVDELQLARYGEADRFDWHLDAGGGPTCTRKISLSVQLSDDADYTGGDLEFSACAPLESRRRRGSIITFPSFLSHRVTAVTHGTRYSLVAWAHGSSFR